MRYRRRFRNLNYLALVVAAALPSMAYAQEVDREPKNFVVATRESPPFSIKNDEGRWTGICIDLWREVAKALKLDYQFRELGLEKLLSSLKERSCDAAVAALSVTNSRERDFDFTHPFYTSGLGIAVAA